MRKTLKVPCIAIRQGRNRTLYTFAVDGKMLHSIAQVSRIGRGEDFTLVGYQRPEVQCHIAEIRSYLETEDPMLPNAIVVAFDDSVRFEGPEITPNAATSGQLIVPLADDSERKPGWIVDGQQRSAALRDARIEAFPVFVTAFHAASEQDQREQFILVNSTKPLPKGLIYELLPGTEAVLSRHLEQKRLPTRLLQQLNQDPASPFYGRIKTPTSPEGTIQDNSLLRMLGNSLSDGALYRIGLRSSSPDASSIMCAHVNEFWREVSTVFPDAWQLPPRKSRLTHGVGITSLGYVMDAAYDRHVRSSSSFASLSRCLLEALKPKCAWNTGFWDFGGGHLRKWNEVQNTPRDCQTIANYLLMNVRVQEALNPS